MADSPHLHSWIQGMIEVGIFKEIIVFPSDFPRLKNKTGFKPSQRGNLRVKVIKFLPNRVLNFYLMHLLEIIFGSKWRTQIIWLLIKRKRPSVVHYHEMQHGGYLLNDLSSKIQGLTGNPPVVGGSTWGSDLTFFGYVESHTARINRLLNLTSVVTAERADEIEILKKFNFQGNLFAPVYISVGSRSKFQISDSDLGSREIILIRGYQHDQGRALNALKALEGIEEVKSFKIRVFSATKSPSVVLQSNRMKVLLGLDIEVLPRISHDEFLEIFKKSRIYIGLSESDGLSTSMVEAMTYGCFPIQSINSAAPLFIEDGVSGFVVDPWDIQKIRESIRISLTNNKLLEKAQITNQEVIRKKYNWKTGLCRIEELYELCLSINKLQLDNKS